MPKSKAAVFTFGRFTPPTVGHAKLINKVVEIAHAKGAENFIFTSQSFDFKKNPIPYETKVQFLRQLFPKANVIYDKKITTAWGVAEWLSKGGYTHVTMVVGQDRVLDFSRDIGKYVKSKSDKTFDPKKNYGFDHFEVVSAGDRDPDAEGVEGASGTKMREFVRKGDFASFRASTPTTNTLLAKKIFNTVRAHLAESEDIHENELRERLNEDMPINEGIHDPGIFKAVFLAGGPGSGKDFILKKLLSATGMVEVSSDPFLSQLMIKAGLDLKMPDHEARQRDMIRGHAKSLEQEKKRLAIAGRLGVIVNGTADDYVKISAQKKEFEELGYDTMMIFVYVSDEESRRRNIARGHQGGRTVPENIRKEKWEGSYQNLENFQKLFPPDRFAIVDNSKDVRFLTPMEKTVADKEELNMTRLINRFMKTPIHSPAAKHWINDQVRQTTERHTNPNLDKLTEESLDAVFEETFDSDRDTVDTRNSYGGVTRHITRSADTATPEHSYAKTGRKQISAIRKEAADAMPYDADSTMGITVVSSALGQKKFGEDKAKPKAKSVSEIVKESKGYIEVIDNTDDLM